MPVTLPTPNLGDLSKTPLVIGPNDIPRVPKEWSPGGSDFLASDPNNWTPSGSPFTLDALHMDSGRIDISDNDLDGAVLTIGDDAHRHAGITTNVRLNDATADVNVYQPNQLMSSSATEVSLTFDVTGQTNTLNSEIIECQTDIDLNDAASLAGTFKIDRSSLHIVGGMNFINHAMDLTSSTVLIATPITGTGTINIGLGVFDSQLELGAAVSPDQTITVNSRDAPTPNLIIDDVAAFKGGINLQDGKVELAHIIGIDHYVFTGDFLSLIDKSGSAVATIKVNETGSAHPMLVSQGTAGIFLDTTLHTPETPPIGQLLPAVDG